MAICNNKKCSLGECDQSETCAAYVPVITRADKIRAMTDEECTVSYEQPKELSEFSGLRQTKFGLEPVSLKRPPQSWCYVESEEK